MQIADLALNEHLSSARRRLSSLGTMGDATATVIDDRAPVVVVGNELGDCGDAQVARHLEY